MIMQQQRHKPGGRVGVEGGQGCHLGSGLVRTVEIVRICKALDKLELQKESLIVGAT